MNLEAVNPEFNESVKSGNYFVKEDVVVYFSNRCPYAEFHAKESLVETVKNRNLILKVIKLETMQQAKNAPSPASIFSLFYQGEFVTTDINVCLESRFVKVIHKAGFQL